MVAKMKQFFEVCIPAGIITCIVGLLILLFQSVIWIIALLLGALTFVLNLLFYPILLTVFILAIVIMYKGY